MRYRNRIIKILSFLPIVCCLAGSMMTVSAAGNDSTVSHVTFTNEPNLSPDLRVTKTVQPAVAGYEVPEHVKFQFVLKLNGEIAAGEKYTLSDRNGEIIRKSGNNVVDFETDENGVFTLEDGQTATFEYVGNNVPYEVTERNTYLFPLKKVKEEGENTEESEEDDYQPDSSGYVLYQKDSTGRETLLHPEYKYQLRGMEKDGYAPVSPIGGSSGNVVPDMESVRFVNQYTPPDLTTTELKVTKTISFPEGYEVPGKINYDTYFEFKLELQDSIGKEYKVLNPRYENDALRTTDSEGYFYLMPGETAVFENMSAEAGYRVEEMPYERMELATDENGDSIYDENGNQIWIPVKWWCTGGTVKEGDKIPASPIIFNNANTSFRVRKTMNDATEPEGVEFTFQLVDAQNNPMAHARYYRYEISSKNLLRWVKTHVEHGTDGDGNPTQWTWTEEVEEWTTDENGYFRLAAGEEAIFCGIEPGTPYTIKEIGRLIVDEETGVAKLDPSYAEQPPQSGKVSATGQLATQNFVNSRIDVKGMLTVTKQVENEGQEGSGIENEFHFLLYKRLKTTADVKNELTKLVKANNSLANELGDSEAIKNYTDEELSGKVDIVLTKELGWKLTAPTLPVVDTETADKNWYYSSGGENKEVYIPVTGAVYTIVTGDITENHATGPDAEKDWGAGEFAIKAGQTARFATLSIDGQYRVEEVGLTVEYTPKPAVTAEFDMDSTREQTKTETVSGTVQTVTRKADGSYEYIQTAAIPQEGLAFTFTNLYKPKKVDIQIRKVDEQNLPRPGAEFMLYLNKGKETKVLPEGADDTYRYITGEDGIVRIENLKPGTYWLYEEKAPSGYRILTEPIEIIIAQTRTGLEIRVDGILYQRNETTETGSSTVSAVKITTNRTDSTTGKDLNDELELTIPNVYFYELPNSGGMGIYWYSIGGMLLMMAAALILYRYKMRGRC